MWRRNNEINSNTWGIEPKEDMLIMFPAHLPHRVNQNLSEKDRISIAYNLFASKVHKNNDKLPWSMNLDIFNIASS